MGNIKEKIKEIVDEIVRIINYDEEKEKRKEYEEKLSKIYEIIDIIKKDKILDFLSRLEGYIYRDIIIEKNNGKILEIRDKERKIKWLEIIEIKDKKEKKEIIDEIEKFINNEDENIIKYYKYNSEEIKEENKEYIYIEMEKLEGVKLTDIIKRKIKIGEIRKKYIIEEVLESIKKLHELKIKHIKIEPECIFININEIQKINKIKLINLGLIDRERKENKENENIYKIGEIIYELFTEETLSNIENLELELDKDKVLPKDIKEILKKFLSFKDKIKDEIEALNIYKQKVKILDKDSLNYDIEKKELLKIIDELSGLDTKYIIKNKDYIEYVKKVKDIALKKKLEEKYIEILDYVEMDIEEISDVIETINKYKKEKSYIRKISEREIKEKIERMKELDEKDLVEKLREIEKSKKEEIIINEIEKILNKIEKEENRKNFIKDIENFIKDIENFIKGLREKGILYIDLDFIKDLFKKIPKKKKFSISLKEIKKLELIEKILERFEEIKIEEDEKNYKKIRKYYEELKKKYYSIIDTYTINFNYNNKNIRLLDTTLKSWKKLNWEQQFNLAKIYQQKYAEEMGLEIERVINIKGIKFEFRLIPPGIYYKEEDEEIEKIEAEIRDLDEEELKEIEEEIKEFQEELKELENNKIDNDEEVKAIEEEIKEFQEELKELEKEKEETNDEKLEREIEEEIKEIQEEIKNLYKEKKKVIENRKKEIENLKEEIKKSIEELIKEKEEIEKDLEEFKIVITKGFFLGKYPITQEQWERIMEYNPSHIKKKKAAVVNVSWDECNEYISKIREIKDEKFELPTVGEWEWACKSCITTKFYWGKDSFFSNKSNKYAWFITNSEGILPEVGLKKCNGFGLYDMLGNVWEWCSDKYEFKSNKYIEDDYDKENNLFIIDPKGDNKGKDRIICGGSYLEFLKDSFLFYGKIKNINAKDKNLGFRIKIVLNK